MCYRCDRFQCIAYNEICLDFELIHLEQSPNPIAGLVTLQGSAPRVMAVTVAMLGDLFVTDVTGRSFITVHNDAFP